MLLLFVNSLAMCLISNSALLNFDRFIFESLIVSSALPLPAVRCSRVTCFKSLSQSAR